MTRDFAQLVYKMRQAQQLQLRQRSALALVQCVKLERAVDLQLNRLLDDQKQVVHDEDTIYSKGWPT